MATTNAAPTVAGDEPYTPIPMAAVASKQVKSIGYDPTIKTLAITFTRGSESVYHYPNVEPELYANLVAAESVSTLLFCDCDKCHEMSCVDRTVPRRL